jgi:quercetin dioxygenase-like cupin family protein
MNRFTYIKNKAMTEKINFNEAIAYAVGAVVSKQIIKKETGNVTLFAFDKGEGLSEHTAPFDALVQLLDGKAEIIIGGQPYLLTQGESIVMPAGIPHALKAIEQFKMLLTMIKEK